MSIATINLLKRLKYVQKNMLSADLLGMIIDVESKCFTVFTGVFGYSIAFNDEEVKFFTKDAYLSAAQFNRLLNLHINVKGTPDTSIKIGVAMAEDGYTFSNHIQDSITIKYVEDESSDGSHRFRVVSRLAKDHLENHKNTKVVVPLVNAGKLKKLLRAYNDKDDIIISTRLNEDIFYAKQPIIIESVSRDKKPRDIVKSFLFAVKVTSDVDPFHNETIKIMRKGKS